MSIKIGQYITDSTQLLPAITYVTNVEVVGQQYSNNNLVSSDR
jgi:hypothetical protein